jgi:NodT family efflux transporter outer membrane factor (OMF) lipoprotein
MKNTHPSIVGILPALLFLPHIGYIYANTVPESWTYEQVFVQTPPSDDSWWSSFNDPVLTHLIALSEQNNFDIVSALKRIETAKQVWNQARSNYYPTLSATTGWNKEQESCRMTAYKEKSSPVDYFSLGVSMNWEIDLFGRIRSQSRSSKAAYMASRADCEAVRISIAASLAKSYIDLRAAQMQLQLIDRHISAQQKVLEMVKVRYETGLSNKLEYIQSQTVLTSTLASRPTVVTTIRTDINAIALLAGVYPSEIEPLLTDYAPLPECQSGIAVGIPTEIIRRRPDISEAEQQIAEYAALAGVAKKDFLPALSLSGNLGTYAHHIDKMFSSDSYTYSIAPQLTWTIFDGMSRKYKLAEARVQTENAIDNYNLCVMTAIQEVENAMASYSGYLQEWKLQKDVTELYREQLTLSYDLFKDNLSSYSDVSDAQIDLLNSESTTISSQASALTSLITLYQALGGSW